MRSIFTSLFFVASIFAWSQAGGWNPELESDAVAALGEMIEANPKLLKFKDKAYGYAVFPKVTKAGLGIGGAAGRGMVYEQDEIVGTAKLKQASIGLQAGGQQYMEVIFFEHEEALDHFKNNKLKFGAQASAVALDDGASLDAAYVDGVAVFTKTLGGLMVEASVGGQHFKFKEID